MFGVQAWLDTIGTLMGADTAWLADATPFVEVHLAQNAFTPGPTLALGDLTEATFTGATALHAASAATQVFKDPANGNQIMQVREPAGGWHWVTTDAVNLPQTIYGYYLTTGDGDPLIAAALFDTPIVLSATGQAIDIGQVRFRILGLSII